MGGLAHYLEAQGIATTQTSLIRVHTERLKPPRALFVPFDLGRPFGTPNEPDFQRDVLLTALSLLERIDGPILENFPNEPPASEPADDGQEGWTCPINLASVATDLSDHEVMKAALKQEIALLRPWYDESVKSQNGRRLDGLTALTPEAIVDHLVSYLEDQTIPSFVPAEPIARALKLSCDDLKHFCYQAALARPGNLADGDLDNWFFGETAAGKLHLQLRGLLMSMDDPILNRVGTVNLLPIAMLHHAKT